MKKLIAFSLLTVCFLQLKANPLKIVVTDNPQKTCTFPVNPGNIAIKDDPGRVACKCNTTTYEGVYELDMTISYTPLFGASCGNPCGASNISLTIVAYNPGNNQFYTITGSPSMTAIAFICGAACKPEDWLITKNAGAGDETVSKTTKP